MGGSGPSTYISRDHGIVPNPAKNRGGNGPREKIPRNAPSIVTRLVALDLCAQILDTPGRQMITLSFCFLGVLR